MKDNQQENYYPKSRKNLNDINKDLNVKKNVTIAGNLNVTGTTTSTLSENVILKDNFMRV